MRGISVSTWMFSTHAKEKLCTTCKGDRTFDIKGAAILHLSPLGIAHTESARIATIREISGAFESSVIHETGLNIIEILNKTRRLKYVKTIINEAETFKGIPLQGEALIRPLKAGNDFREVIDKACQVGEFGAISKSLKSILT